MDSIPQCVPPVTTTHLSTRPTPCGSPGSFLWWENRELTLIIPEPPVTQTAGQSLGSHSKAHPSDRAASHLPPAPHMDSILLSPTAPGPPSRRDLCGSESERRRGDRREACLRDRHNEAPGRPCRGTEVDMEGGAELWRLSR